VEDKRYSAEIARQNNIDRLKFGEAADNADAIALQYEQQGRFPEADAARKRAEQLRNNAGVNGGQPQSANGLLDAGFNITDPEGYGVERFDDGGAPQGGLLGPNGPALAPPERKKFDAIKDDPEAVVAELKRRGFKGNALNVELNKIYGSGMLGFWNRSEGNPQGYGTQTVDSTGNVERTFVGSLLDQIRDPRKLFRGVGGAVPLRPRQ
jgi:hypothetical protein